VRVARALATGLVLIWFSAGCDAEDVKSIKRETREAEEEFRGVYGLITSLKVDTHRGPDGVSVESVDVTVRLPQHPSGLTEDQIETDANIVVRKHIRKVRNVIVKF